MIIPSIDIQKGSTVQLIGGETKALDAGAPGAIADKFSIVGEIAVIDLDAAMGQGSNASLIEELVRNYDCRVGGGIRDLKTALRWLDLGAKKIIIGTAASSELLKQLPRERIIVALDCRHGEVVVEGWKTSTGKSVEEEIIKLRDLTGGFLVTFVEREGRMQGIDIAVCKKLKELTGDAVLTVAGGVSSAGEIRELDQFGIDSQVGMAIYTGQLSLADSFLAAIDPNQTDSLWPTVVVDEHQTALGLVWSDRESVHQAIDSKAGVYHSRKRGLWVKGESSGNRQELLRIDLDCDRDSLRFTVRQQGSGFCHSGKRSCWGADIGIARLGRRLKNRLTDAPANSYTRKLFNDPLLLKAKLLEEAGELADAKDKTHITREIADLLYFTLVKMTAAQISLEDVTQELDLRELKVTRRPGHAKPKRENDSEQ